MQFNYDTSFIKLTILMWFQVNDAHLWDITFEYLLCTLEIVFGQAVSEILRRGGRVNYDFVDYS